MEHNRREEKKITARQSWMLIAGLVLVCLWHQPAYPAQAPRDMGFPIRSGHTLMVSKLAASAPIVYANSHNEDDIQVFLRSGVVHLLGTAEPGKIGNCYIVGHSSDYEQAPGGYKTVFARLPDLAIGDEIQIRTPERVFEYSVVEARVVEANDLSVLTQETGGRKLLTLQTSYPIGSAKQRLIVVAQQREK